MGLGTDQAVADPLHSDRTHLKVEIDHHSDDAADRATDDPGDGHPFPAALSAGLGNLVVTNDAEDNRKQRGDDRATGGDADDSQHQ